MKEKARAQQWNDGGDEGKGVKGIERKGGEDDVKHVLGRFLSRQDQYHCNQSCNSNSSMQ